MFRKAGISDYVLQQDGAPARASKATQRLCAELFPNFISKERWPSTSPGLNPLDYFAWGFAQQRVNELQPKSVLDLQLAIEQAVSEIPPKMIQAAIDGFYKRCKLCLAQGGETFKHVLKSKAAADITTPQRDGERNADGDLVDVEIVFDHGEAGPGGGLEEETLPTGPAGAPSVLAK